MARMKNDILAIDNKCSLFFFFFFFNLKKIYQVTLVLVFFILAI